jgi:hypothetical protein
LAEIIASICRDIGVSPQWALWDDEDWCATDDRTRRLLRQGVYDSPDAAPASELDRIPSGADPPPP